MHVSETLGHKTDSDREIEREEVDIITAKVPQSCFTSLARLFQYEPRFIKILYIICNRQVYEYTLGHLSIRSLRPENHSKNTLGSGYVLIRSVVRTKVI